MLVRPTPRNYSVAQRISDFHRQSHEFDVCVVGGGMAGLIAAISCARHGASVALVHDRPVFGGNASSEIRMWICGAHGRNMKETGLLEEIQLDNCHRNPTQIYSIWDSVLWSKAVFCPNLRVFLNTTCTGGTMSAGRLASITAWTLISQTWHTIQAKVFIDCSGDSVLVPITGAAVRVGREAREEFNEDIEPMEADCRTMGNTLLMQLRETDSPQPFVAPTWAYKMRGPSDLPSRHVEVRGDNFWWLEIGGLSDTVCDADAIRDELVRVGYGVWDYLKNHHPRKDSHANVTLEWMGMLPGKRENRRYVGEHILTQNDIRAGGRFDDIVAYGGWSMDDHHPAGLLYPGKPTVFHPAPSPYGIPYRCFYSKTVANLMFAGRNMSATHAAMSSTRVMGTTSMMGQAVGTAAALCVRHKCDPRELYPSRIAELQGSLMDDDQYLPGLKRAIGPLTRSARLIGRGEVDALRDGHDRPIGDDAHAWTGTADDAIELRWDTPVDIRGLRLVLDSNLNQDKRMPCSVPLKGNHCGVPLTLLRKFRVEAQEADGSWRAISGLDNNYQRLVRLPIEARTRALRLVPEATWGSAEVRIFSLDVLDSPPTIFPATEGPGWQEVVAGIPKADLAPPQSGLEHAHGGE